MSRLRKSAARLIGTVLSVAGLLVLVHGAAAGADSASREYAIKAAFLYKFADYVEWPQSAFGAPNSALTVCIIGRDPFGSVLDELAKGERIAGRDIVIRRLAAPGPSLECQVAYVSHQNELARTLDAFDDKPVLTVTDGGAAAHGIINFVIRDNRVRFEIDTAMAATNGLAISSKLLALAAAARDAGKRGAP